MRLRDAAEAVGFYRGEGAERGELTDQVRRESSPTTERSSGAVVAFLGWNRSMNQIVDPLPLIIQAPRLFAGQIKFGDVTQSASAFSNVQGSLSFFRSVYDAFAGYRAAIIRLHGLVDRRTKRPGRYRL